MITSPLIEQAPGTAAEGSPAGAVPRHVGIIMDGNGRWAAARHLPRGMGHRRGVEAVRDTVKAAQEFGVRYLPLYAFSSENWKRPAGEVGDLMWLLRRYVRQELRELHRNGVRLRFIGGRARLAPAMCALLEEAEETTRDNDGLTLILAIDYGGQDDIVQAARRLAAEAVAGRLRPEEITEADVAARLSTAGLPDPDLIIRTSGEKRLSNFLLWQSAYAELVFVDLLWPDFGREALRAALDEFGRRERRFGA